MFYNIFCFAFNTNFLQGQFSSHQPPMGIWLPSVNLFNFGWWLRKWLHSHKSDCDHRPLGCSAPHFYFPCFSSMTHICNPCKSLPFYTTLLILGQYCTYKSWGVYAEPPRFTTEIFRSKEIG